MGGYKQELVELVIDLNPTEKSSDPAYTAVVLVVREKTSNWIKDERIEVRDERHGRSYCNGFNSGRSYAGLEDLPIKVRS